MIYYFCPGCSPYDEHAVANSAPLGGNAPSLSSLYKNILKVSLISKFTVKSETHQIKKSE